MCANPDIAMGVFGNGPYITIDGQQRHAAVLRQRSIPGNYPVVVHYNYPVAISAYPDISLAVFE